MRDRPGWAFSAFSAAGPGRSRPVALPRPTEGSCSRDGRRVSRVHVDESTLVLWIRDGAWLLALGAWQAWCWKSDVKDT